jgi:ribosomal protein S18 acetylase RimI-like enzyme
MEKYPIFEGPLSLETKDRIQQGFADHAIESIDYNGFSVEPIAFEFKKDGQMIAVCVAQLFWGALHIKSLFVEKEHRFKNYGKLLMEHAFEYGKKHKCQFVFVETMSFQAPEFYKKLGFKVDFVRKNYAKDIGFYYLTMDLNKS